MKFYTFKHLKHSNYFMYHVLLYDEILNFVYSVRWALLTGCSCNAVKILPNISCDMGTKILNIVRLNFRFKSANGILYYLIGCWSTYLKVWAHHLLHILLVRHYEF
jgi:hypothetical protein